MFQLVVVIHDIRVFVFDQFEFTAYSQVLLSTNLILPSDVPVLASWNTDAVVVVHIPKAVLSVSLAGVSIFNLSLTRIALPPEY